MARARSLRRARARGGPAPASGLVPEPLPELLLRPAGAVAVAAAVVALALWLYGRTLAPTITLVDSGELALAAHDLGVAHPPGTPLWVLVAHAFTRLPWGSVAQRVNLSSAVFAALAAGGLVLAWRAARVSRPAATPPPPPSPRRFLDLAPALAAGLLLALSRTLWSYATLTEVYALNTALVVALLGLVCAGRRPGSSWRPLQAAALLLGFALGAHHATVVVSLPALGVLAWPRREELDRHSALTLASLTAGGAALVYAVLPLAALRAPLVAWGNPVDLERFLAHVSGRQYSAFVDVSATSLGQQAAFVARWLVREFGTYGSPLALALVAAGLFTLRRRDPALPRAALVLLACNLALKLVYGVSEDQDAYLLPLCVWLAFLAGFGAEWLLQAAAARGRLALGLTLGAVLLAPALAFFGQRQTCDRSRFFVADDFVADTLAGVAPGGLLLTSEWQLYSPYLYYREIEGRRRDALIVDVSLLRRSWYFDTLRRQAPELMQRTHAVAAAFLEDLRAWEHDPGRYAKDAALTRRINERFHALVLGLVDAHAAPVYATSDVVLPDFTPDPDLARTLLGRFTLVPRGLAFELGHATGFRDPGEVRLRARGLFDGTLRLAPDDVALTKVRPLYLGMLLNRGRYLAASGQPAAAALAYREALARDPGFEPAQAGLRQLKPPAAAP